jgi:hypothetical protein
VLCSLVLGIFQSRDLHAETCRNIRGASSLVGDADAQDRLDFLDSRVAHTSNNSRKWFWWWTGGFAVATAGQIALVPLAPDTEQRRTLWVNTGSTLGGMVFMAVAPPNSMGLARRLRKQMPDGGELCARLAFTEKSFERAAAMERFGTSWLMHGGNLLFNTGMGLILGLAWGYWDQAFLTTTVGTLVGEIMIWTQPMDAHRTLTEYRTGTFLVAPQRPRASLSLRPMGVADARGLSVHLEY